MADAKFRIIAIPRARYQKLLYEAALKAGVEVRLSSGVKKIDASAPAVVLVNGEKVEGDIIIGANGK